MELIVWTDALGLAVFAAVGAHYGSLAEPRLHLCGCGLCGMFTATFGGVTRDVLLVLTAASGCADCANLVPFYRKVAERVGALGLDATLRVAMPVILVLPICLAFVFEARCSVEAGKLTAAAREGKTRGVGGGAPGLCILRI